MRTGQEERCKAARDQRLKRLLTSMRSMDGSRNHDFPALPAEGEGAEGHRLVRPRSPAYDDFDHKPLRAHRGPGHRQRHGDASTDEIIRFVRGYQLEREPTLLRLQKKAPLPGIGQVSQSLRTESSFVSQRNGRRNSHTDGDEEDEEDDNDEDVLLDNEVAAIDANQRDPLRQLGVFEDLRFASTLRGGPGQKRHDRYTKTNASYGPPASHLCQAVRPLDSYGDHMAGKAHVRKNFGRSIKQLPPIAREELPERPSAPSPSLTPPGEEEEELDSAGEPVDFIDAP